MKSETVIQVDGTTYMIRARSWYSLDQAVKSIKTIDRTPEEHVETFEDYNSMDVEII